MCSLNPYMVRSTLLRLAWGRQTAQGPKCELLIFTSFLVTLGPNFNTIRCPMEWNRIIGQCSDVQRRFWAHWDSLWWRVGMGNSQILRTFWKISTSQIQACDRVFDSYRCQMMSLIGFPLIRMHLEHHTLCNRDFSVRPSSWCRVKRGLRIRLVSKIRPMNLDIARHMFSLDLQCYVDMLCRFYIVFRAKERQQWQIDCDISESALWAPQGAF